MEQERITPSEETTAEAGLSSPPSPETEGATAEVRTPSLPETLPDEVAEELCALFSCSREALGAILASTSNDPAQILSLVKTLTPVYIALKVRFDTRKRGELGGAMCFIAKGSTGDIIDDSFWVSAKQLPETFDISASWESVRNGIRAIGGNPERTLYTRMLKAAKNVFSPTAVNNLFRSPNLKKEGILSSLADAFNDIVHHDLVFELKTEVFNKARLEMGGLTEGREQPVPEQSKEGPPPSLPPLGIVQVVCKPVLDPVHGTAVSDLRQGDMVVVELERTGGLSGIITKILDRAGEHPTFPVTHVERLPSGQSLVKLFISKGIEGVLKAGADLKLKRGSEFFFGEGIEGTFPVRKFLLGTIFLLVLIVFFYFLFGR